MRVVCAASRTRPDGELLIVNFPGVSLIEYTANGRLYVGQAGQLVVNVSGAATVKQLHDYLLTLPTLSSNTVTALNNHPELADNHSTRHSDRPYRLVHGECWGLVCRTWRRPRFGWVLRTRRLASVIADVLPRSGYRVFSLAPVQHSLEDVFMSLVEGGDL